MGLTVTIIPAAGAPAVIYDANKTPFPDGNADGFLPVPDRIFQNDPMFRSPAPFIADRFNQALHWDMKVTHSFATLQACQDFTGQRAQTMPRCGKIQIINTSGQGAFVRYLYGAWLRNIDCAQSNGVTCVFRYNLLWTGLYSLA